MPNDLLVRQKSGPAVLHSLQFRHVMPQGGSHEIAFPKSMRCCFGAEFVDDGDGFMARITGKTFLTSDGPSPDIMLRSEWHNEAALTRTRSSRPLGSGMGISSITRGAFAWYMVKHLDL